MHGKGARLWTRGAIGAAALVCGVPAVAADIETVLITNAGNAADTSGRGAVGVRFRVAATEVTNTDYVEFLNAVADADPNGLFNDLMTSSDRGGIFRGGMPGTYTYTVKPNFGNKPVVAVGWNDTARFCNWLHNGQPAGPQGPATTEAGAYDLSLSPASIQREADAVWFLPTHDEWYKAAYFDPFHAGADASGTADYWLYPTMSDVQPAQATANPIGNATNPGPNVANYDDGADWNGENGNVTSVGSCAATSPWGLFDMAGNANEWTETLDTPIPGDPPLPTRTIRGGDFANPAPLMTSPEPFAPGLNMTAEGANVGFRVARRARPGDITGDDIVDVDDLVEVILNWGVCDPTEPCIPDVNDDGTTDVDDLVLIILRWD